MCTMQTELPKGGWTAETLQNDTLGCGFAGTQA